MTEAAAAITLCLGFAKQPFPTKLGSCGTVLRNAELKVIDPETGCSLGYNQPGEICIRGQQVMKGLSLNFGVSLSIDSNFVIIEVLHTILYSVFG